MRRRGADLEIAGLLHDVGRVAISKAVWDKPERLTADLDRAPAAPGGSATGNGTARVLDEAAGGRLGKDAVDAVLADAGRPAAARPRPSTGLSDREVEVLALVTQGCSNPEIASRLVISRRTAASRAAHLLEDRRVQQCRCDPVRHRHHVLDRDR